MSCCNETPKVVSSILFSNKFNSALIFGLANREVLCIEYQYLRAITGSADGKVRIWNILTGDCIRVMRGNSQCDPVLSMSVVDNRVLINTEFNVILMEFEIVQYDYASCSVNSEEASESNFNDESKRASQLKKPRNYSLIRASRSELVATPNVKLFNDERKTILDHSSRPISGKNLKDAQIVHNITSKPLNISRNSIGNISELGLAKRQSIVQSINATIISQTSLSVLSNTRATVLSHSHPNQAYFKENKIEANRISLEKELESFRNRTVDLNDTKQYLREQLKEIKQSQQSTSSDDTPDITMPINTKNSIETKSCIETRLLNRNDFVRQKDDYGFSQERPTSSPSRVDTKTRIKLKPYEISKIKSFSLDEKFNQFLDQENESKPMKIKKNQFSIFKQTDSESQYRDDLNEFKKSANLKTHKVVSKVFETQEKDLKTNSKMYPVNVKSKLPNPKIVNPVLMKQQQRHENQFMDQENKFIRMNRSKSAFVIKQQQSQTNESLTPIFFKPKSDYPVRSKPKTEYVVEACETSKLAASSDKLNLMTFKQVDQIIDTINGYFKTPDKEKETEQADFYKKIWMLKSKGKYHGSLLAKPKTIAPEIRE